ncbi:hypothetical protein GOV04_03210 [Candidatus Woesearchaeota archaeon]|nr:hypothetical protein [Candidatus Woesearchaeota archaeon]
MKQKETTKTTTIVIALLTVIALMAMTVLAADPVGPEGTQQSTSTRPVEDYYNATAEAGNVTEINFTAISVTANWAGFYGNVSGTIVLANSLNETLYDWSAATPSGQIYASRDNAVTWTSIGCANLAQLTTEQTNLNMPAGGSDNITNTFSNVTDNHPQFTAAGATIPAGGCYETNLHNSTEEKQASLFNEVLLYEGSDIVYTSLLEDSAAGFDTRTYDFEMMVGEDGRAAAVTNYYFYVEIQ